MRRSLVITCLAFGALALTRQAGTVFPPGLPVEVGDVSTWQVVGGDLDLPALHGGYRFYVNPSRQALYQLMRYRATNRSAPLGPERVAFVRNPGSREPMLCWERQAIGTIPEWRPLVPGTQEYVDAMRTLMRVIAFHRAALRVR